MVSSKLRVLSLLFTTAMGAPVEPTNVAGVVEVPLTKALSNERLPRLDRRDDTPESSILYHAYEYALYPKIGNQTQTLVLDTGSDDVWVYNIEAQFLVGYTPGYDSTYKWLNNSFGDNYGNYSSRVAGSWVEDTITVGNASVPNYPFGLVNATVSGFSDGLFGIGPKVSDSGIRYYPAYLERLKEAGEIQSTSFSLFNNLDNSTATLLFGGIDTAKFNGTLYTLGFDTAQWYDKYHYHVNFAFEGVTYDGLIDSGTSLIMLPQDVVDPIAAQYGATWNSAWAMYTVSEIPDELPGLDFEIGGINITIPFEDLWTNFYGEATGFALTRNVQVHGSDFNVLGDPILRQMYLFFDLEKSEIAFAPIVLTNESNLVPVSDSIPYSTPAPNSYHS